MASFSQTMIITQHIMRKLVLLSLIFILIVPELSCSRRTRSKSSIEENSSVVVAEQTNSTSESQLGVQSSERQEESSLSPVPASKPAVIKIFIENSGSMNGYINSTSEFQSAIQKMVILLKHYYGQSSIQLSYVNRGVYGQTLPSGKPVEDFAVDMLQKTKFAGTGSGHHGDTNLNDIIGLVLEQTEEDGISILISDYIYSVGNDQVAPVALSSCENKTMGHFLEKTKILPTLTTLIIQLRSSFNGRYWDYAHPNSNPHNLNCTRPYYMCVIGSAASVADFNNNISIDEMSGFNNKLLLSSVSLKNTRYAVLGATERKGRFVKRGSNSIDNVTLTNHGNEFQFSIGVDLSKFPLNENEKEDLNNYSISHGNYQIVDVKPIDVDYINNPNDKALIKSKGFTHMIVVKSTGLPINDCTLNIKMEMPKWVSTDSSIDDRRIDTDESEQLKTFGIEYFIRGIFEAYSKVSEGEKEYFTMNINITKKI